MATRLTFLAAALLAIATGAGAETAGKQAWTQAATSPGLHSPGQSVRVAYAPDPDTIPAGAVITQVYAHREYAGSADIQTSLCWNGITRCIDITGRGINTRAFDGLDAGRPMYLVHRLAAWRGTASPVYVKGNVSVWYRQPQAEPPVP